MNKIKFLLLLIITNHILLIKGVENKYTEQSYHYMRAKISHENELVKLINDEAIKDKDKIVILPKKFLHEATKKAIMDGRIFIALNYHIANLSIT